MRIDDNAEALAMMNRALGSLEAKIREAYNKGYRDGVKEGVNQATQEIMEYTYGMLTAEKFGLQHKIKSMVAEDEPNCSEKPNNCDTCRHYTLACDLFSEICRYEPKTEPQIIACPIQEEDAEYAKWLYEPQTERSE